MVRRKISLADPCAKCSFIVKYIFGTASMVMLEARQQHGFASACERGFALQSAAAYLPAECDTSFGMQWSMRRTKSGRWQRDQDYTGRTLSKWRKYWARDLCMCTGKALSPAKPNNRTIAYTYPKPSSMCEAKFQPQVVAAAAALAALPSRTRDLATLLCFSCLDRFVE